MYNLLILLNLNFGILHITLKVLDTCFEMILNQWGTYDRKCKQVNEGCLNFTNISHKKTGCPKQ